MGSIGPIQHPWSTVTTPTETPVPSSAATELVPPTPSAASDLQDHVSTQTQASARFNPNDNIVFLGFNPSSVDEVRALKQSVGAGKFTQIKDTQTGILNGHDLNTPEGIDAFVETLPLSPDVKAKLKTLLEQVVPESRDEFGQLAQIWSRAENGQSIPSRMVLSGHSDGTGLFGEENAGELSFATLGDLANLMPRAAAQIEDIHISGCNTGFKLNAEVFQQHFPNLKTYWAYTETAPGLGTMSPEHLKRWEQSTRGRVDDLDRDQVSKGLGVRGKNVAVWSEKGGHQVKDSKNAGMSEEQMATAIERALLGELESENPQRGPLYEIYNSLQRLRGSAESKDAAADYDGMIARTLKLRFYQNVSDNFQKTFGPELEAAYKELGLPMPDFSKLSRREAVKEIEKFQAAFDEKQTSESSEVEGGMIPKPAAMSAATERARLLLDGFKDMSPSFFGATWIEAFTPEQIDKVRVESQNWTREQFEQDTFQPGFGNILQLLRLATNQMNNLSDERLQGVDARMRVAFASEVLPPGSEPALRDILFNEPQATTAPTPGQPPTESPIPGRAQTEPPRTPRGFIRY